MPKKINIEHPLISRYASSPMKGLYSEILLDKQGSPKDHFIFRACKVDVDSKISENLEGTDIEKFKWFDLPLLEDVKSKIIPTDLIMLEHILSDKDYDFKEFVMQETENPNELQIVYLK